MTKEAKITNTHDKFFKSVFTQKEAVADFIDKLIPAKLSKHIDLDSLELDNNEYIDDELKNHCSDVVYNCDYIKHSGNSDAKKIPIKVALLFEHKSYPEKYPHLQLLRYLLNIWEMQIKQKSTTKQKNTKQSLMPVIPIIFYHGKNTWQHKAFSDYFADIDVNNSNLRQFLPLFDYLLLDTSKHNNHYFQQLDSAQLQYSILAMKHVFNMPQFFENIAEIFADIDTFISTEAGRKFFKTMIIYLYQYSDLTAQEWENKMQTVSPQAKKEFISTYDQAIATGMEKGRQEGMQRMLNTAKNFKDMGLDISKIAQATGLSVEQIEQL